MDVKVSFHPTIDSAYMQSGFKVDALTMGKEILSELQIAKLKYIKT